MNRRMDRRLAAHSVVLVSICMGCTSAEAERQTRADVERDRLPAAVTSAASAAVEGIEIVEAKRRQKKPEVVYKIGGVAAGKAYELKITESGQVLEVAQDGALKARKQKKSAQQASKAPAAKGSPFRQVGTIRHGAIRESSGLVASRRHDGVLWTHNDKGNAPELFAIDATGRLLAQFPVQSVNDDWEDIAIDDQGKLYVGRIGNNKARSDRIEVLRVAEPAEMTRSKPSLPIERNWVLRFPDEPFDCEALFVQGTSGYVISKHLDGSASSLYRFDLDGPGEQVLQQVADLPTRGPVTGADLSRETGELAVLTYESVYVFPIAGDIEAIRTTAPMVTPTPGGKLEGVCFTPSGILLTAESREIYLLPRDAATAAAPANAPATEGATP